MMNGQRLRNPNGLNSQEPITDQSEKHTIKRINPNNLSKQPQYFQNNVHS